MVKLNKRERFGTKREWKRLKNNNKRNEDQKLILKGNFQWRNEK